jgi:DNA-directed RNA polymerase beta subunit
MYRNLPDLLAIQLESFRYFLEIGLQNQLNQGLKNLGIRNDEIRISPHSCKFSRPKLTPYDAIQSLQTYETIVYCPIEFIPLSLNSIESPSRLISECKKGSDNEFLEKNERNGYYEIQKLPLLTESSYFIVNGIRRVVVNQMVRCPNIYYKVRLLAKNKRTYTVSFISDRGVWIRIERDRHDFLWVRINEARIEMFIFLRALGITDKILTQSLEDCLSIESVDFDRNFILKNFSTSLFESKKNGTKEKTRQFLYENIFNEKKYSLSMSGRMRMNKKFGFSSLIQTLRPEDFLAGLNAFIQLEIGKLPVDDIDHLKNRRVRLLHHLLSDQTRRGLKRLHQENGIFLKNEKNKNENAFDFVEKMQEKNQIAKKKNFISTFPCKTSFLPWKKKSLFQTEPILLLNKNKICQKIPRIFDKKKTKILKTNNQVFKTRQSILRKKISKNTFQKNGFCIPLNASQCFHFNKKKKKKKQGLEPFINFFHSIKFNN